MNCKMIELIFVPNTFLYRIVYTSLNATCYDDPTFSKLTISVSDAAFLVVCDRYESTYWAFESQTSERLGNTS